MAAERLELEETDHARLAFSTLGAEDRRAVAAWYNHLRNWNTDPFLKANARPVPDLPNTYILETTTGIAVAFEVGEQRVKILSLLAERAIRLFRAEAAGVGR